MLVAELKSLLFACFCAKRDVIYILTVSLPCYVFEIVDVLCLLWNYNLCSLCIIV